MVLFNLRGPEAADSPAFTIAQQPLSYCSAIAQRPVIFRPLSSPLKFRLFLFEKCIYRIFVIFGLYALRLEQGLLLQQLIERHYG